jgi:hypothetical protein
MRLLLVAIALLPAAASAETVLCVAEAGAVVEDGNDRPASAALVNASTHKYLVTQEKGVWRVKELGKDYVLFNKCTGPYFCERAEGFAGAFLRTEKGTFSIMWMTQDNGRDQWVVAKGRCSAI